MKLRVATYAACMLLTGSVNTIATKYQDLSVVGVRPDGKPILFEHPAFQSACMFLGEALCLVPYFLLRWRRRAIKAAQGIPSKPRPPLGYVVRRTLAFAIPTLCDATGTTLLNVGLFYTYASTYQMLRGTLVLFTGFLTILVLRRSLYLHHWLGMTLIAAGAAIVGAASLLAPAQPHSAPQEEAPPSAVPLTGAATAVAAAARRLLGSNPSGAPHVTSSLSPESQRALFGDAMVVLAQTFTALQFVLEEKFLGQYRMQPLLAVGIEGAWGVVLCLGAIPALSYVHMPTGLPVDDGWAAFTAMAGSPGLTIAIVGSIFSIGAFNFFGLSVTQALSGASRATIDACRTLIVWIFSLMAGWEQFHQLQVVGFLVLISGTSLYNELLRSCVRRKHLPGVPELGDGEEDSESVSSESSVSSVSTVEGSGALAPGDASKRLNGYSNKSGGDAEDGDALRQPLIPGGAHSSAAAVGVGPAVAVAAGQRHSSSRRITGTSGAHAQQGRHGRVVTMARSMRLGVHALSPHDLVGDDDDDDESDALGGTSVDVVDPMMLASTPYWGQPSLGTLTAGSDGLSTASGTGTPRLSSTELDDPAAVQAAVQGAVRVVRISGRQQAPPPPTPEQQASQGLQQAVLAGPELSFAEGVGHTLAAALVPPPAPSQGFLAFLAARQAEQAARADQPTVTAPPAVAPRPTGDAGP